MKLNERGFMLLSAIFLTVILSFAAMMTLQSATHSKNEEAALRLHAINLANEQLAIIESGADVEIPDDDLKSYGLYLRDADGKIHKKPVEFKVTKNITDEGNLRKATVTVTWKDSRLDFEKIVRRAD